MFIIMKFKLTDYGHHIIKNVNIIIEKQKMELSNLSINRLHSPSTLRESLTTIF